MVYLPRIIRYKPLPEFYANLLAEFIGTFFLIITISMSLQQADTVGALAPIGIGFMLCSYIFCYGYSSGAIYNPAVSVALFMIQLMDLKKAIFYMIAQVSGGICAALVSWFLVGVNDKFKAPAPKSDDAGDIIRSMVAEFVFTFGLLTVIFNVACSRQRDNQHYGLAIAFFVIAAAFSVGGISGGAFNPAVATGLQIVNCMAHDCRDLRFLWLYWVAPVGGAMCSALTFGLMHPVEVEGEDGEMAGIVSLPNDQTGATRISDGLSPLIHRDSHLLGTPRVSGQHTRFSTQSNTRVSHGIQAPHRSQQPRINTATVVYTTAPINNNSLGSASVGYNAVDTINNNSRVADDTTRSAESMHAAFGQQGADSQTQVFMAKQE